MALLKLKSSLPIDGGLRKQVCDWKDTSVIPRAGFGVMCTKNGTDWPYSLFQQVHFTK